MGVNPLEHVDEVDHGIDLGQYAALDEAVGDGRIASAGFCEVE